MAIPLNPSPASLAFFLFLACAQTFHLKVIVQLLSLCPPPLITRWALSLSLPPDPALLFLPSAPSAGFPIPYELALPSWMQWKPLMLSLPGNELVYFFRFKHLCFISGYSGQLSTPIWILTHSLRIPWCPQACALGIRHPGWKHSWQGSSEVREWYKALGKKSFSFVCLFNQ